ncbi:Reverse transcriptase [Theobroma cacao]|nr:Reverse transcriptase [Theobroma cacao]
MVAIAWSDSDTSSSETDDEKSEERANICLMAQEDENRGHEELFAYLEKRKGGTVSFGDDSKGRIHGIGKRLKNMYVIFLEDFDVNSEVCFVANAENDSWLWHRRLGHGEFEMSMMGELKYFLGLQIKQSKEGIFINQERYTHDMLKKFDMLKLKSISTPMSTSTKLDIDEKGKDVDQKFYRDADFAGSRTDRKGTSGTCQFLERMLVSWSSKKQNSVALSTAEAKYVSLGYSPFKNRSYSPSLVKEFYSGIALKEKELVEFDDYVEDGLNVYLNGKELIVTAGDLGNLLKLEGEVGVKLQKMEDKITELENKLKEKENMGSEPVATDSFAISSTAPTQQGAKGSVEPAEKFASSDTQVEGSTYKFASPVLQIEDSPQGVEQPANHLPLNLKAKIT